MTILQMIGTIIGLVGAKYEPTGIMLGLGIVLILTGLLNL